MVTMMVPRPLSKVTGLPNRGTEIQIRKARLTVLATLKCTDHGWISQTFPFCFRVQGISFMYSILGCVLPLQEVVLCQKPPTFSVLCYPCP